MSLDLGSQGWLDHAVLIPILDPEQPRTAAGGAHTVSQSLRAMRQLDGLFDAQHAQSSR